MFTLELFRIENKTTKIHNKILSVPQKKGLTSHIDGVNDAFIKQ